MLLFVGCLGFYIFAFLIFGIWAIDFVKYLKLGKAQKDKHERRLTQRGTGMVPCI